MTNDPATFCTLMNQVFHEYLGQFVVVYLDDIVVFNSSLEETRSCHRMWKDSNDEDKLRAIKEWRAPTSVTELCSFLGLANYYRWFIEVFFRRAAPLTELLKKGTTWRWPIECQTAFNELKVMWGRVLRLVDVSKSFVIEIDTLGSPIA
ncbi:reverse transcriptase [Cucumis melo var. makuwa]|uniref:Reverse transcriptase n=1 Tax=Cucumis melo var. makuwa TaxID=1194695 RepID=A0A5D3DCA3_CUCMM|nr:reverse transcriptase [Cucumis melo var. makuwa]TYK20919.1 reverse transcriptase [Cucumis melo var. makuwa]